MAPLGIKSTNGQTGCMAGGAAAIERKAQSLSAELYCWRYHDSHIKVCLEMNVMMSLVIEAVMTHDNFISSKIFFKSLFVSIRHQFGERHTIW